MVESALQCAPYADFGKRFERIHDEEAAIGAEKRTGAEVHEIAGPATAGIIGALDGAEQICVRGSGLENDGGLILVVVGENNVYAVDAKGIALRAARGLRQTVGRLFIVFAFALAFLERIEIIEKMMADFFEIFGDVWPGVFFLEFFDDTVDEDGGRFLLKVTQLAGQFAGEREGLAVHHREFLTELLVLSLDIFRNGAFKFSLVDHFGDVLDRDHLAFEDRENFRQRHGSDLHVAEGKLFARDSAREIVH